MANFTATFSGKLARGRAGESQVTKVLFNKLRELNPTFVRMIVLVMISEKTE